MSTDKPLAGIRVLEMGQLIAGPFAGQMLAYYGAEVIKIEAPGVGDPLRTWRVLDDSGTSYWWRSIARNKKSVTLNLADSDGQSIARELIDQVDVLIENFRPGKMESWNLGPDVFKQSNPGLVYTRVSGYGQTGPYANPLGFASVCEGVGGLRYINGQPGETPVRPNLSLGDTMAGVHAVIGTLLALFAREHKGIPGQLVDVSIVESVFSLLEGVMPEYDGASVIREPSGSTLTGIVPTNTYLCADGKYIVIGGNGDSIFKRLMHAVDRADMAEDERLSTNPGRVAHEAEIDSVLARWASTMSSADLLQRLELAEVPAGPINAIDDIVEDPHFNARDSFESVKHDGKFSRVPAMHPKLSATPGGTEWLGPALGEHTDEVLGSWLNIDAEKLSLWRERGVI